MKAELKRGGATTTQLAKLLLIVGIALTVYGVLDLASRMQ